MKNLKIYVCIVFMFSFVQSAYALNLSTLKNTLSKYCVNCDPTVEPKYLPGYDRSKSDKPTMCVCDTSEGLVYNPETGLCEECPEGYAATDHAIACQPICPSEYYLVKKEGCEAGSYAVSMAECPSGYYKQVWVDANITYVE